MNITLVNASLSHGGAERVLSIMANHWAEKGENITIITIDCQEKDFFHLDSRVRRIALGLTHPSSTILDAIRYNLKRLKSLRLAIRDTEPQVVISFLDTTNIATLIAVKGLRIPIIISERCSPYWPTIGYTWRILRNVFYPSAHCIVVQTTALKGWGQRFVSENRVRVIGNPVRKPDKKEQDAKVSFILPPRYMVAMGRLVSQKGFDLLIKAFAKYSCDEWYLVILGEGEQRESLEKLSDQLGVGSRVLLPGVINNPGVILRGASLFVLSSRYEGFPNALLEAMSYGLPAISYDCQYGPSEIIRDGFDGLLIPPENIDALAAAMSRLLQDEKTRLRMGNAAREVVERFSVEKIVRMWDSVILDVIERLL